MSTSLKIVLDPTLVPQYPASGVYPTEVSEQVTKQYPHLKLEQISPRVKSTMVGAGLVGLVATAYQYHLHLMISPTDVHLHVLSQLTAIVMEHPAQFESVFVKHKGEPRTLMIPTNDPTLLPMDAVTTALSGRINIDLDTWLPSYSETSHQERFVGQAYLAAAAGKYYQFCTYLCGIPSVNLTGTKEDWAKLAQTVDTLCDQFQARLDLPVLTNIKNRVRGMAESFDRSEADNVTFWKGIFSSKSVGCVLVMNGWMVDMVYLPRVTAKDINAGKVDPAAFTRSMAMVFYKNLETSKEFLQVVGALTLDEEWLYLENTAKMVYQCHTFECQ